MMKRIMAMILSVCMVLTSTPIASFAQIDNVIDNDLTTNASIKTQLEALALGGSIDKNDVLLELMDLGLLDGNGDLVSMNITVGGVVKNLDEVRTMVTAEDVDLNEEIIVEGVTITMEQLKKIIEIEDELKRIETDFLGGSGVTITAAHEEALTSLVAQFNTNGINASLETDDEIHIDSTDILRDVVVTSVGYGYTVEDGVEKIYLNFALNKAQMRDITMGYSFSDGSCDVAELSGLISIPAGVTDYSINIDYDIVTDERVHYGDQFYLLTIRDLENAVFDNGYTSKSIVCGHYGDYDYSLEFGKIQNEIKPLNRANIVATNDWWFDDIGGDGIYDIGGDGDHMDPACFNTEFTKLFASNVSQESKERFNKLFTAGIITHLTAAQLVSFDNLLLVDYPNPNRVRLIAHDSNVPWESGKVYNLDAGGGDWVKTSNEVAMNWPIPLADNYIRSGSNLVWENDFNASLHLQERQNIDNIIFRIAHSFQARWGPLNVKVENPNGLTAVDLINPSVTTTTDDLKYINGEYQLGDKIPVVIEFSEPIRSIDEHQGGSKTKLYYHINGKDGPVSKDPIESLEDANYQGRKLTFMIPVENYFSSIEITKISSYKDVNGYLGEEKLYNEVFNVKCVAKANEVFPRYTIVKNGLDIDLELMLEEKFGNESMWAISEAQANDNANVISSLTAKVLNNTNDTIQEINFRVDNLGQPTKIIASFTAPVNTSGVTYSYTPALYYQDKLIYTHNKSFEVEPTVYLKKDEFNIVLENWVDNIEITQYVDELAYDKGVLDLGINVSNQNASFISESDFIYSSSNENIASISDVGEIVFTGSRGSVYFKVTAKNGGNLAKQYSHKTDAISVVGGKSPFISIPSGADIKTTFKNEQVEILWSTNLVQNKVDEGIDSNTQYDIDIYEVIYSGDTIEKGTFVESYSLVANETNNKPKFKIPGEVLNNLSLMGRVSYLVEINVDGLSATGYVAVESRPAKVSLTKLDNFYITDDTNSITVLYDVENFDDVNTASEFEMTISKNENEIYKTADKEDLTGSYSFEIENVLDQDIKDIYTVTVRAKNALDGTWSFDSYIFSVYNADSIKIHYNNEEASDSVLLDNNPSMASKSSQEIIDLKRRIYMGGDLAINKDEYEWNIFGDAIKWASSDHDVATINSLAGGIATDIRKLSYPMYVPNNNFILNGAKTGTSEITAVHGLSKMSDSIDLTVNTLKDKLYLVNVYPKAESTVKYINGNNQETSVQTDTNGEIAIYEASGIKSDLWFKTTKDGDTYLGTIVNGKLISGENDLSKSELYPLNIVELLPVSKPIITLRNPLGVGYTGAVKLTGGVYRNGEYCSSANLNQSDGKIEQTVNIVNGKLEIEMDVTQFKSFNYTESISPSDKLDFVYYIQAVGHEPILVYVDGNKNFEEIKEQAGNTYSFKEATDLELSFPLMKRNTVLFPNDIEIEVTKNISRVGPNKNTGSIDLLTEVICLGGTKSDVYTASLIDQYSTTPAGGSMIVKDYPFIDVPVLQFKQTLNENTLWMPDRASRSIDLKVFKDGTEITKLPYSFKVINLSSMDINEAGEVTSMPDDFTGKITQKNDDYSKGDQITSKVLTAVGKVEGLDNTMVKMMLSPTADPSVFNTVLSVQIGYGDVGGIEDKDGGTYLTDPTEDAGDITLITDAEIDAKDFSPSTYKQMANSLNGKRMTSVSPAFDGGGYITGQIVYNFDKHKWEMNMTSSNINATAGVNLQILYNTLIAWLPVTAEFSAQGSVGFSYSSAYQYGLAIEKEYKKEFVSDYLKTLRFDLYIYAFGGIGIDYSVLAVKIGVYGQQDLSYEQRWLEQDYLANKNRYGTELRVEGEVGIKFTAKALLISYEKILASAGYSSASHSGDWNYIDDYWDTYGNGSIQNGDLLSLNKEEKLEVVRDVAVLEDRGYLKSFSRRWQMPLRGALNGAGSSEVQNIQINAYPYSNPVFTKDGAILGYVSDMDSTSVTESRVSISKMSGNAYLEGEKISDGYLTFGDSNLSIDGTASNAVATWISQVVDLQKGSNAELTLEEVTIMNNSSEIMASIYNGTSWSEPVRLTTNGNSEASPIAMTNGSNTIVAYRSMYAPDSEKPFEYGENDKIVYRVYGVDDEHVGSWSEEIVLYNGTLGNVKGLEGAMLADGTASIVYTIEKKNDDGPSTKENQEVIYSVINPAGEFVTSVFATNDNYCDENPKITTHKFEDGVERFVAGWFSTTTQSDIRVVAYNNQGLVYNRFIDSLSEAISSSATNITSNFKFAQGGETDDITIVWSKPMKNTIKDSKKANKDALEAIKIVEENSSMYATSVCNLAEMDDYTAIDFYSARIDGNGDVKAVILGTDYDTGITEVFDTGIVEPGQTETRKVIIAVGESGLYSADGAFENSIRIDGVEYDYNSVIPGMEIPVKFNLYNSGIDPITSGSIELDGVKTDLDFTLSPSTPIYSGSSKVISVMYTIPDPVKNVDYTISATFDDGENDGAGTEMTSSDKVNLYFPGTGISKFEIINEAATKRDVSYSIYNDTRIGLENGNYRVAVKFYDNQNEDGSVIDEAYITSQADLDLIDQGLYNGNVQFDVNDFLGTNEEIPSGGIRVYCSVNVEEKGFDENNNIVYTAMPEINTKNNQKMVTFESLIAKANNEMVTLKTVQKKDGADTVIDVTVKNNSLVKETSGNLIISTFNAGGTKTETQQGFSATEPDKGLVKLGPEETVVKSFRFTNNQAVKSQLTYSDAIVDGDNADLGSLELAGQELIFDRDTTNYVVSSEDSIVSILSFTTSNPNSTVKIDGLDNTSGEASVSIADGEQTVKVEVTSADESVIKEYNILLKANVYVAVPSVSIQIVEESPTDKAAIYVSVQFSEPVVGFELSDIIVKNAEKSNFVGVNRNYSFKLSPIESGDVLVDIGANVAIGANDKMNTAASQLKFVSTISGPVDSGEGTETEPDEISTGNTRNDNNRDDKKETKKPEQLVVVKKEDLQGNNGPKPKFTIRLDMKDILQMSKNKYNETVMKVNENRLEEMLLAADGDVEKAKKDGKNPELKITLESDEDEESMIGQLSGSMFKKMGSKNVILEVKTKNASYNLPANQIDMNKLIEESGQVLNVEDLHLNVRIGQTSKEMVKVVEDAEKEGTYSLVVPPVDFEVTCTYDSDQGEKSLNVDIDRFDVYVERTIKIPSGVDPKKISTGVIIQADGSTVPVPTEIVEVDGVFFARISSLTNSTYSVIWNPKAYTDLENHWAQVVCNDMGSRLIVLEDTELVFSPDREVTRFEFVSSLVRALGINGKDFMCNFDDVKMGTDYYKYVAASVEYELVDGYPDNTFRAENLITREEAAALVVRTMKIVGLQWDYPEEELSGLLNPFVDKETIDDWAKSYVEICVKNKLIEGNDKKEFLPKYNLTKAELSTIIDRLLHEAGLL